MKRMTAPRRPLPLPRRNRLLPAALMAGLALSGMAAQGSKTRVACVGDSITYGACVENREKNSYPAVLGGLLGEAYEVRNFGVNGATLLKKGDLPWWTQAAFRDATAFDPQIVIIKLGSNDTKPQNWRLKSEFAADYRALIEHFKSLPAKPVVWIALPVPVLKENFGINRKAADEERPMILEVAKAEGCPVIDLHAGVTEKELFDPDGIHPNAAGARKMAELVHAALGARRKAGK